MNSLILTRCSQDVALIKNVFRKEGCDCKVAMDLCQVERFGRNFVLEFLLVDNNFFNNDHNDDFLRMCLGILNNHIPILYFDTDNFEKSIYLENDNLRCMDSTIQDLFSKSVVRIDHFKSIAQKMLRPAEKKIYTLLKTNHQKAVSLDEMCIYLWGNSNSAHVKTLYSYIHRIKKILDDNTNNFEWLEKEKKGFYKIVTKTFPKDIPYSSDWL